jgi:hypothetical protein
VIPTLDSLASLFAAGLSALQVRELCEAAAGIKLSRLNLEDSQVDAIRPWCEEQLLFVVVTDYFTQSNTLDEGKGNWSNIGRRFASDGVRFVYVSLDQAEVREALAAERAADFAPQVLGRLLRIPTCCTEFFQAHKALAELRFFDEYAYLTSLHSAADGTFDWRMNYLGQYFGYSLHGHYVCRWDCPETLRRVERVSELVRTISPHWYESFQRAMRGIAILDEHGAVHLVRAQPDGSGWVRASPHLLMSTTPTEVSTAIRRAGGFHWRNLLEIEVPGLGACATAGSFCAVPFCTRESVVAYQKMSPQ